MPTIVCIRIQKVVHYSIERIHQVISIGETSSRTVDFLIWDAHTFNIAFVIISICICQIDNESKGQTAFRNLKNCSWDYVNLARNASQQLIRTF